MNIDENVQKNECSCNTENGKKMIEMLETERKRIVSELHDTSLQNIAHFVHMIELASLYIDKDPARAKMELNSVSKGLHNVIEDIRSTIFNLRPMTFDDLGLKASFERLLDFLNADKDYIKKKKAASLTYSTQQVGGDELTRAKDPNMITALAGKSAGVQINKSASGLGGSAKVSIRGTRSAYEGGNNQPLYVIDGVPMLNTTTESTSTVMGGENDGVNRDAGDGISNLNPEDIESMSILKGASAAALYGPCRRRT